MPKRKRRRKPATPPIPKAPPQPTLKQHNLTWAITKLNRIVTLLAGIPLLYIFYDFPNMLRNALWLLIICMVLFNIILSLKMRLHFKTRRLGIERYFDQSVHLEFRKHVVSLLGLSFFSNVVALMPILYVRGYISRLTALLPGKEFLSNNVSLTLAFIAGAIVSGILGNLAYDILKYAVRKTIERKG
jgi:hypothetical protein